MKKRPNNASKRALNRNNTGRATECAANTDKESTLGMRGAGEICLAGKLDERMPRGWLCCRSVTFAEKRSAFLNRCRSLSFCSTQFDLKISTLHFYTKHPEPSVIVFCFVALIKWCWRLRRPFQPKTTFPHIEPSQWPVFITSWEPSISDPDDNQKQINRWPCCQDAHQYAGLLLTCNDVITHELRPCSVAKGGGS